MVFNNVLVKEYEIKYYEQNLNSQLKESSLLNLLQDIATISAESLGFGPSYIFPKNYAWVVLKYHIELYKDLKNLNKLIIKTESRGTTKLYAFRDFELYSSQNELLGKVISAWALIDITTRKILPMQRTLEFIKKFEPRLDDLEYGKIESLSEVNYQKVFDVCFDDIDVNKHVNNSNYISWALEVLPVDFRISYLPKVIDIKYKKEISFEAKVTSIAQKITENDNTYTLHCISDNISGEELVSLKIQWCKV